MHSALTRPGDELAAETLLARIREDVLGHLQREPARRPAADGTAAGLRDLLDTRTVCGITLAEAARTLGAPPASVARAFVRAYGITPHRYLVGRRVDHARHLLARGWPPADAAIASGFFDQAHLTRHFTRVLGVSPAAYARGRA